MTSILNKFKSLIAGAIILSLFIGVTLSSCSPNKKTDNKENVEAASASEEHPEGGEHPEGSEHPEGGEHPSGEEHPEGGEHPEGEEHPSDSTKQE